MHRESTENRTWTPTGGHQCSFLGARGGRTGWQSPRSGTKLGTGDPLLRVPESEAAQQRSVQLATLLGRSVSVRLDWIGSLSSRSNPWLYKWGRVRRETTTPCFNASMDTKLRKGLTPTAAVSFGSSWLPNCEETEHPGSDFGFGCGPTVFK
ncbi:hypothetical protein VTO42DRAFT_1404 [Malbranchea cinnamomea]